ncbi:MAG: DNA polymerase III subunit alpha, partial [Rhodothermales bacterium]|nr:DNA polymerase III subunit alpha [Rhodothermales bacterium]
HLHCRSWFSFLAGASSPEALAAAAAKRGVGALALTDVNGVYGVVRFQTACREAGVKPIFGSEVNVEGAPLVLIARDETGFRNLNLMLTAAHQRSRENPQVRLTELMEHADGLFCLTGAYGSRLYELIDAHEREAAYRWVRQLHCMFEDRLSIEVATHIHPGDKRRTNTLERLSRETYVPLVATGDVRYARSEDYRRYDLMTCTRLGITIFDDHPERPRNAEAHLRAEEGMRKLIPFPEAFLRAREIAEACTLDLIPGYITPPAASVPPPHSPRAYLRTLCWEAFERRYPPEHNAKSFGSTSKTGNNVFGAQHRDTGARAPLPEDPQREKDDFAAIRKKASAQLEKELGVIGRLELDEFFLVVHEIVDKARELGIRCAGRGSAANSIVAYLLGITGVDPVRNNLLFERFLHAGRKGTPDIDVDFDSERRDEIIAWIEERFGMEQTAMTATLITYRVRSAIRDTAKAFGWPMETVNRLSKAVPSYSGRDLAEQRVRLEQITGPSPLLDRLLEMAAEIAGAPRHLGLHSGGMILSREPLHHFTPVQVSANGVKVVQFDKNDVEALGLVKFDVLGLRMLATLSEADELIQRHEPAPEGQPPLDIDELPLDDIRTFNMIRASKTLGVFQIESQGQLHLLAQHQPEDFKDLINEIALFRPGPLQSGMVHPFVRRRRKQEEVVYDHPLLEPILKDTYGVIVFQEQVLEVAHRFANMSLEEADEFRRLMSKFRDPGEMEGMRDRFVEGAMRNGVDFGTATKVFENVANFVGYGFCRSHAAAFAKTVYQSAYLKRHHTAAFMAAFMQHRPGMYNQMTLEEEARRFGVPTLLPHINRSGSRFDLERVPAPDAARQRSDGEAARRDRAVKRGRTDDDRPLPGSNLPTRLAIRKPLAAIQGVSAEDARAVVWERMTAGSFVSVRDFYERVELSVDQFRHVARSGALDELAGDSRRALWEVGLLNRSVGHPGRRRASTLFDLPPFTEEDVPELPSLTLDERLSWDYETHSAARVHPMTLVRRTLNEYEIRPIASCFELGRVAGGRPLSMGKGGLLGAAFSGQSSGKPSGKHDSRDGPIVTVAGIAMLRQRPKTANGVFFLTLEDETGFIQTVIYSKVLEALDHVFSQSSLIVRGRLQVMGNWRGLVVSHAWPLNGILGGYEGHASMGGGRDRMIKRLDDSPEKVDLFGAKTGERRG